MLRIIHTADWHLGQSFHHHDRDYEHGQFLEWLLNLLVERRPDVLLLSGDVFDSINPPATAQRRYFSFLDRARTLLPTLQFVITAGNHDAAARLEAPADLLESLNINVIGTVSRDEQEQIRLSKFIIPLRDAQKQVQAIALAVPFLRPSDVPLLLDVQDPYLDGIRELYRLITAEAMSLREREYPHAAIVGLGHCHMQDGAESQSERSLVIGGAEALRTDTFPKELVYVALGHLHKPQQLDGGRIRYSGSPIPLSFSEKDYEHRVLEVVLDGNVLQAVTPLFIPKAVPLLRIPGGKAVPISELLPLLEQLPKESELDAALYPFLEVRILDDGPDPTRRARIEQVLEGKGVRLASLKFESMAKGEELMAAGACESLENLKTLNPIEIMRRAYRERYQSDPEAELVDALQQILREFSA